MKNGGKKIRVAELFAGVGGFRIGLEGKKPSSSGFQVVWSSQWEPGSKKQHASEIYVRRFGRDGHSNQDIAQVPVASIPDHDMLVGGFPCQDYSVARTLSQASGIEGKKGVLWWSINKILKEKGRKAPSYLMLENVDRLVKSPASQRGRDFAIMLASLSDLGYAVEWRIINAADYGMPQRRRRVYILGYKSGSMPHKELSASSPVEWAYAKGLHAKCFPVSEPKKISSFKIDGDLTDITKAFNKSGSRTPFETAGVMINREVWTFKAEPKWTGKATTLADIIEKDESRVPKEYFVDPKSIKAWKYLKGGKKGEAQDKGWIRI